jgi:hypothetical protein
MKASGKKCFFHSQTFSEVFFCFIKPVAFKRDVHIVIDTIHVVLVAVSQHATGSQAYHFGTGL